MTAPWFGKEERPRPTADDSGLRKKVPAEPRLAAARAPGRRFARWLFNGSSPEPLPSTLDTVEDPVEGKLGVCCSGGGIRSAAFSLGALQQLREDGELERASYLAAVSGGSYIATAISLLRKTGEGDSEEDLLERKGPFAPGSPEEQYLRNRSKYLAPGLADKIYLGWRIVLGLVLNLLFIAVPLVGLAILFSGLAYAPALPDLVGECHAMVEGKQVDCAVQPPLWFWLATFVPLGLGIAFGVATLLPRWRNDAWQRFFSTWATRLLLLSATLGLLLFAVPYLVELIRNGKSFVSFGNGGAKLGAGTLALLAGVITQLGHVLSSSRTNEAAKGARKFFAKLGKGARRAVTYGAAALVGPLLLLAVYVLAVAAALSETGRGGSFNHADLIWIGAGVLAGFAVVYFFSDITNWSLHPFYKRRLSTVFALKRVRASSLDEEERRRVEVPPPPGSGKEPGSEDKIGIAVERDYDELVPISRTALTGEEGTEWPTLLVCAAANVSDGGATPPGRRVTSFTFSANTVGGPLVGAVPTWQLETAFESPEEAFPNIPPEEQERREGEVGRLRRAAKRIAPSPARKRRGRDVTLAAAMAMSGAAISPSMGKETKGPLTFLMALANIRLGVWVPNPRWVREIGRREELRLRYVRPRPFYLLCEMLGINRIGAKYLYVTDGGHYENLGLVELLRRGCTQVYCLDASGVSAEGAEFGALGEAIALARSELGVEIEFENEKAGEEDGDDGEEVEPPASPADMVPGKKKHFAKRDVVTATIRFPPRAPARRGGRGRRGADRKAHLRAQHADQDGALGRACPPRCRPTIPQQLDDRPVLH